MAEYSRREQYLAVIAGGSAPIPDPVTREDYLLAKIAGADVPLPEPPYTRYEAYLAKLAGALVTAPQPVTQLEMFLYAACGYDVTLPVPVTQEEILWAEYINNPGGTEEDITELFIFSNGKSIRSSGSNAGRTTGTTSTKANLNFVDISAYSTIKVTMTQSTQAGNFGLAFYTDDNEESYDSGVNRQVGDENGYAVVEIPVPDTAKYVRTTYWSDTIITEFGYAPFSCIGISA